MCAVQHNMLARLKSRRTHHELTNSSPRARSVAGIGSDPGYGFTLEKGVQGVVIVCSARRGAILTHIPTHLHIVAAKVGDEVTHVNGTDLTMMTRAGILKILRSTRNCEREFRCRTAIVRS